MNNRPLIFDRAQFAIWIALAASLPLRWMLVNSVVVIAWGALVIAEIAVTKRFRAPSWKHFLVLSSFFLLTVLSIFWSDNISPLMSKMETRLSIAAIPLLFMLSAKPGRRDVSAILTAFIISCFVVTAICVGHTLYINSVKEIPFTDSTAWYYSSDNLVEVFGFHPSYFSIYCAFAVFGLIYLAKEGRVKWIWVVLYALYMSVFILFLASRVGLVAFAVVVTATILYEAWIKKKLWIGLVLVSLFLVAMAALVMSSFAAREKFYAMLEINVHKYNEPFRINRRFEEWGAALEIFRKHPLAGVGVGDMQDELQKIYQRNGFTEGFENEYNPHNLAMDTAAALGLLGLCSLLILFVNSVRIAWIGRNILFAQFIILFFLISMVEASLSVQKGIALFSFFNSLLCLTSLREEDAPAETH